MGFMVLAFPASVTISVVKGLRTVESVWFQLGYLFMCLGVGIIVTGLCLFGLLLTLSLRQECFDEESSAPPLPDCSLKRQCTIPQITQNTERSLDEDVLQPALSRFEAILNVERRAQRVNTFASPQCRDDFELGLQWSISNSSIPDQRRAQGQYDWSMHLSGQKHTPVLVEDQSEKGYVRGKQGKDRYLVAVSGQDRTVLRKIIVLTVASVMVGAVVVVLSVLFTTIHSIRSPYSILVVLWVISLMELFVFSMITLIFTMEIKVKSKENLQFVSELARRLDKMKVSVTISPLFPKLSSRFHSYVGQKSP